MTLDLTIISWIRRQSTGDESRRGINSTASNKNFYTTDEKHQQSEKATYRVGKNICKRVFDEITSPHRHIQRTTTPQQKNDPI